MLLRSVVVSFWIGKPMKTAIPSVAKDTQNPANSSDQSLPSRHSGRLAQLAAMMNQSPRVQAQLKLSNEIQNNEPVQRQLALAAEINQAPVIQPRLKEEDDPAQREAAPNRTGLPDQLKAGVENLSSISLDDVKVHYNSAKPAQLNALAYAQGTDIHIAPGQEQHLPHEAWHIVQQAQGRVKPTMQRKGLRVNDDETPEKQTDVIQAVWVNKTPPFLLWQPHRKGFHWWFNSETEMMAYTPADVSDMNAEQSERLTWQPHREWQKAYLATVPDDKDEKMPEIKFDDLLKTGRKRWTELKTAMEEREEGKLDPVTQSARERFFDQYYTTTTRVGGDVESQYNALPSEQWKRSHRGIGQYSGNLNLEEGKISITNTYALLGREIVDEKENKPTGKFEPGETYYNPGTQNEERMPASEILFQQWRRAAGSDAIPRLRVKEESVAGDGVKMVWAIREGTGQPKRGTDVTYRAESEGPEQQGFLAMLAVPNVTAAIFLIRDHGTELQIRTITQIEISKTGHLTIRFG